ncbi:MAG: histidine kinase [Casimicrobiaceae bacterium]
MIVSGLRRRYERLAGCALASLSETERQDVRVFDHWIYRERGWRWVVCMLVGTTLAAWGASHLPLNLSFAEAAVLFNVVVLMLAWAGLSAWFGYRKFQGKLPRFVLATIGLMLLGAAAGGTLKDLAQGRAPLAWFADGASLQHVVATALVFALLYASTVAVIASLRNRAYLARCERLEDEARRSELDRRLAESQLRLLQLQIEPHFVFNTLGSAQQLAEKGAPEAARLISDLIRFLRAATPTLRDALTTLRQEADTVTAYLAIMQTRLRGRLAYVIDVPDAVGAEPIPPGMLITLVENAIKHGIEPDPAGGTIVVAARVEASGDDTCLAITVADTGAGLGSAPPGQGIGLSNIRERLALRYGGRASLDLEENAPRGFRARLRLPVSHAPPRGPAVAALSR